MEKETGKTLDSDELFEMRKRRITLPDGRYLIFYSFGDAENIPAEKDNNRESSE